MTRFRPYSAIAGSVAAADLMFTALAAPALPRFADKSPSVGAVDVELVIMVEVSYSMDPDEQALQREGCMTAVTSREFCGRCMRAPTVRSPSLISNGPASPTIWSACRGG
jgi:hypothetical protein